MAQESKAQSSQVSRKLATLIAVCIASFLEPLDATVVVVALPSIERSLNATFADLQWVINAYTLTFCAFLMTGGALADLFGRRRLFLTGLLLFAGMSLFCGLAPNPFILNLARGLQGIGAAFTFTTTLALLVQEFDGKERATAFGIWGTAIGLGLSFGPLVGGFVTQGIGWRWIFLGNVPVCIAAIALTLAKVRESRDPDAARLDWLGVLTFTPSFFLLIYGLVSANERGWNSPIIIASLAGAALLLLLFLIVERIQRRPMVDLSLFQNRTFTGASIVPVVLSITFFSFFIYIPLYFQSAFEYSPVQAGLALLPMMIPLFFMGFLGSELANRISSRFLLSLGLLLVGLGLIWMSFVVQKTQGASLTGGLLLMGIGAGLINGEMSNVAMSVVPKERSGMASGINNTMRQIGYGGGIAALGAILVAKTQSEILTATALIPQATPYAEEMVRKVIAGNFQGAAAFLPSNLQAMFIQSAQTAFTSGMYLLFIVAAVIAFVGAALSIILIQE